MRVPRVLEAHHGPGVERGLLGRTLEDEFNPRKVCFKNSRSLHVFKYKEGGCSKGPPEFFGNGFSVDAFGEKINPDV